jgi:plasmid stability protein
MARYAVERSAIKPHICLHGGTEDGPVASLTIRNITEDLKTRLRIRAAEHGRSMEEEARRILRDAVDRERPRNLAELALEIFGPKHGVDLEPHPPVEPREPPNFGE